MALLAEPPPPIPLALPIDIPQLTSRREDRRLARGIARTPTSASTTPSAAASPSLPTSSRAFRRGKAEATLLTELEDARGGAAELHQLQVTFPEGAGQRLLEGCEVESEVTKVVTKFGLGRAVLGVRLVLAPRPSELEGGATLWHLIIKVQELGVVQIGRNKLHWAARLVLALASGEEPSSADSTLLIAAVPDHRPPNSAAKVEEMFREVHTARFLPASHPLVRDVVERGSSAWEVALSVRDAGGPPPDEVITLDGCC